jgi:hypothetical protein
MTMTIGAVASGYNVPAAGGSAVRFNSSSTKYSRSASGLNASTNVTWACWVKLASDRNAYSMPLASDNGGANYTFVGAGPTGTLFIRSATSAGGSTAYDFVVGTWTYIASVWDITGNDYLYYCAAPGTTLTPTIVGNSTGLTDANTFYIGSTGFGDWLDGSVAAVKIWTAALTQAELEAELPKYAPQRTSNLWANYTFQAGPQTTDNSGNGRTLTQGGTPVLDSSGPPIT